MAALLVRWALEDANTLDEAIAVFRDHPRTCEYYYVIADGKSGKGVGMEGSWDTFTTIAMGASHEKLPVAIPATARRLSRRARPPRYKETGPAVSRPTEATAPSTPTRRGP